MNKKEDDMLKQFESTFDRNKRHKKIALEALETCKGKNLNMLELKRVIEIMEIEALKASTL